MSTLGIGLIVRDAADVLPVCLESIRGIWDDLVVVDTGSKDRTVEIAQSFGARIFTFPWTDDFSAARNYCWEQLKTDYRMWLDSDDILVGREYIDECLAKLDDSTDLDGVILGYIYALDADGQALLASIEPKILNRTISSDEALRLLEPRCTTMQWRERIVRNIPDWKWLYPVHEALPVTDHPMGKYDKIKVVHRRHTRKVPVEPDRNLAILERIPPERRDQRVWFYFGLEYASRGPSYIDRSIDAFERYLSLSTVDDEKYMALHFLGDLYRFKGDFLASVKYNISAAALRPDWRDAYAGLVETCVAMKDWSRAVFYGRQAKQAQIPDTPFAYNPVDEEIGWLPAYITALVELGRLEEALEEVRYGLSVAPRNEFFQQTAESLAGQLNLEQGARSLANAIEFFLRVDNAETAALLISRTPRELYSDDLRRWISIAGSICGRAARGELIELPLKDACRDWLSGVLSHRPWVQRILQVGGPKEMREVYSEWGLSAEIVYKTDWAPSAYDAVILWNCLERVKYPAQVVQRARKSLVPGGEIYVFAGNGPSRRGLVPPDKLCCLRAYSPDSLRQTVGTVDMVTVVGGGRADSGDLFLTVRDDLPPGRPRRIAIVCPFSPEPWGPWSLASGIGGSEEAVIRLSRAFARRGHIVTVYGSGWSGVDDLEWPHSLEVTLPHYRPLSEYEPSDILIAWRYPEIFLGQLRPFEAEFKFLWLHDSIEPQRVAAAEPYVDVIWTISAYHASLFGPSKKIYVGRNGIDPWEFTICDEVPGNPRKLVYISTPFRGLDILLKSFWPEIKAKIPGVELHAYYGFESADRLGVTSTSEGKAFKEEILRLVESDPQVVWHGRVGQPELYRELAGSGVWVYPSRHREENCISAYLCQASGVWPVVFPIGALDQSVVFGWKVSFSEFVGAVVDAVNTEQGREGMKAWARFCLSWDSVASDFERLWVRGVA